MHRPDAGVAGGCCTAGGVPLQHTCATLRLGARQWEHGHPHVRPLPWCLHRGEAVGGGLVSLDVGGAVRTPLLADFNDAQSLYLRRQVK